MADHKSCPSPHASPPVISFLVNVLVVQPSCLLSPIPTLWPYWSPLGLSQREAESKTHIVLGGKSLNPTQSVCGALGLEAGQKGGLPELRSSCSRPLPRL